MLDWASWISLGAQVLILTLLVAIFISLWALKAAQSRAGSTPQLLKLEAEVQSLSAQLGQGFAQHRQEIAHSLMGGRQEQASGLSHLEVRWGQQMQGLTEQVWTQLEAILNQQGQLQSALLGRLDELRGVVDDRLQSLQLDNAQRLEQMRQTVDEKLQRTLNDRLSQSFESVRAQLQAVQSGLGEMRVLAEDVGGLKRVLSNVKLRGGLGELQLQMLLEQILAPAQYAANVSTRPGSQQLVEFAIKLPGQGEEGGPVWLPIDAKFPRESYARLQAAHDGGELAEVEAAQRELESTVRRMAKDIHEKYIEPPHTTDFGILFVPFEGLYAELARSATLIEALHRDFQVVVAGPSTLAALLNSLQMGFRTLAIQQRSAEVWQVLGQVKGEFQKFSDLLHRARGHIQKGVNQLDDVLGVRTRAIERRLRAVSASPEGLFGREVEGEPREAREWEEVG